MFRFISSLFCFFLCLACQVPDKGSKKVPTASLKHHESVQKSPQTWRGKVLESQEKDGILYLKINILKSSRESWVALVAAQVPSNGVILELQVDSEQSNFHSKGLNKTFKSLAFAKSYKIIEP